MAIGSEKSHRRQRRPRGTIIERKGPRGTVYVLKFDVPTGIKGVRDTRYERFRGTYEDAKKHLTSVLKATDDGLHSTNRRTLSEWTENWLEQIARRVNPKTQKRKVSARTHERYAELLRKHVLSRPIGNMRIQKISTADIEACYLKLAEAGLSPTTITHIHRTLFQCLGDAKRLRLISENPAEYAERTYLATTDEADDSEPESADAHGAVKMSILSREDLGRLVDGFRTKTSKNVSGAMVLFALDTGARRGEILALRWSDIDLDSRLVRVSRSVDKTKAKGVRIKPYPKTKSSQRSIAISRHSVAALQVLLASQKATQAQLGRAFPNDALVFHPNPCAPASPFDPDQVTKAFTRIAKSLGFSGLRLHDLRHNCASHLLKAGRPITDVSKHLGHSTPAITLAIYSHAIPEQEPPPGLLDDLIGAAPEVTALKVIR